VRKKQKRNRRSLPLRHAFVEKHSREGASTQRSLHCAPPDFLYEWVALAKIMRLSSRKAHTWPCPVQRGRKSGYAFGRDDKGEGGRSHGRAASDRRRFFFITLGEPQAHDSSGRDDKVVAMRGLIFHGKSSPTFTTKLSSRPKRSGAERRSAVSFSFSHADSF